MAGKFIVFEGPDHSGKSSQIFLLQKFFEAHPEKKVLFTREPGGLKVKLAETIRNVLLDTNNEICPEAEVYLYGASRAQHIKMIKQKLEEGYTVISDRYYYSSLVYQGLGRGLGIDTVQTTNDLALQGLYPDHVFYIKVDLETYIKRKSAQISLDRLERESTDFFKKIIDGYDDLFTKLDYVTTISTDNKDIATVHSELMKYFEKI